jgi:peptidoglycan/LPS O-acetylase OafA/YrhL
VAAGDEVDEVAGRVDDAVSDAFHADILYDESANSLAQCLPAPHVFRPHIFGPGPGHPSPRARRADNQGVTLNTPRLGYIDALRAIAVAVILLYEIVKHAPGLIFPHPIAHRAAFAGLHGFEIFLVISGFVLAYPALAALRNDGAASLDVRRYMFGRLVRIIPAYYAVLAVTILLPYAAARYGLTAFGHPAALPPLRSIVTQAFFAEQHFGNDAFWAVAVQMRAFLVFPILLAAYVRRPIVFAAIAVAAMSADLFTPAHRFDLGALPAFMLGIVAADWRVRPPVIARGALPVAIAWFVAAFFLDPFVSTLPGPRLMSGIENWNPLWTLGAFALVVGCGSLRWAERTLTFPGLPQLGLAAFAIALVGEPVASYVMRKAAPTLGLPTAAANAYVIAVAAGIVLWLAIDRRFADPAMGRRAIEQIGAFIRSLRGKMQLGPLTFETPPPTVETQVETQSECDVIEMAPALAHGDVAMLVKRSGSADDLANEIRAAAARFDRRGSFDPFYFDPRRLTGETAVEEAAIEEAAIDDVPAVEWPAQAETPHTPIHFHLGPSNESG